MFDKKLEDTLKVMNSQSTLAGHTSTEEFVEELSKHFKTNKICEGTKLLDCFTNVVYWGGGEATPEEVDMTKITKAKHFGQKTWNTDLVGVQFANGVNALIAYNPTEECVQDPHSNQINGQKCLAILYDTSGSKNPNTSGKDLRSINVSHLGSTCTLEIGDTCFTSFAFKPEPMTYADCAGENASNPSTDTNAGAEAQKLGIKKCYYSNDY